MKRTIDLLDDKPEKKHKASMVPQFKPFTVKPPLKVDLENICFE